MAFDTQNIRRGTKDADRAKTKARHRRSAAFVNRIPPPRPFARQRDRARFSSRRESLGEQVAFFFFLRWFHACSSRKQSRELAILVLRYIDGSISERKIKKHYNLSREDLITNNFVFLFLLTAVKK